MAYIVRVTDKVLTPRKAEMGDTVRERGPLYPDKPDRIQIPFSLEDGSRIDLQLEPSEASRLFMALNDALLPA